jgi:hypothetical protein
LFYEENNNNAGSCFVKELITSASKQKRGFMMQLLLLSEMKFEIFSCGFLGQNGIRQVPKLCSMTIASANQSLLLQRI